VKGPQLLALVVRPARRLSVNGDQFMPAGPQRLDPVLETPPEQDRVNAVDQRAQPAVTGDAEVKGGKLPQEL
jgi:hypothetical protein